MPTIDSLQQLLSCQPAKPTADSSEEALANLNQPQLNIISPSSMSVIEIAGLKTKDFLQGQLTCDLNTIQLGCFSAGALCDHKGRMISNFFIWHDNQHYYLLLHQSVAQITADTLNKYGVFSQVTATLKPNWHAFIVTGDHWPALFNLADNQTTACSAKADNNSTQPLLKQDNIYYITPKQNAPFAWCCGSKDHLEASWQRQLKNNNDYLILDTDLSYPLCVQSSLAIIEQNTSGLWTPHMIDWQLIGGVSFTKGCYVGQEIIARTEHLGKLKRHLYSCQIEHHSKQPNLAQPKPGEQIVNNKQERRGQIICCYLDKTIIKALAVIEDRALNEDLQWQECPLTSITQVHLN